MQGQDGSAWSLYANKSGGSKGVERILYSDTGLATFQSPRTFNVNAPSGYSFTDLGDYGWRNLFHGGRLEPDNDQSLYNPAPNHIVNRQSGLLYLGGGEFDASGGRQLVQDKYAFFRAGTIGSGAHIDANAYSPRGALNALTRFNGSEPTWDESFWNALGGTGVAARLGSSLSGDWGLNFIGAAVSPGSYAMYGQVTVPGWVSAVSKVSEFVGIGALAVATGGLSTVALAGGIDRMDAGLVGKRFWKIRARRDHTAGRNFPEHIARAGSIARWRGDKTYCGYQAYCASAMPVAR